MTSSIAIWMLAWFSSCTSKIGVIISNSDVPFGVSFSALGFEISSKVFYSSIIESCFTNFTLAICFSRFFFRLELDPRDPVELLVECLSLVHITAGNVKIKVDPSLNLESTSRLPPRLLAISKLVLRPNPTPSGFRAWLLISSERK